MRSLLFAVMMGAAPGTPAPTVTALGISQGDTLGGEFQQIVGTDFTGATAVKFNGTDAASFVVVSATLIYAIAPPNAAGVGNITVTTGAGTSATGAANQWTVWDPGQLALTGWWERGGYLQPTWSGRASAGVSGGVDLTSTISTSPDEAMLEPYTDGFASTQYPSSGVALLSSLVAAGAGTFFFVFDADSSSLAAPSLGYDEPALVSDSGGNFCAFVNTTGVATQIYDGGYKTVTAAASGDRLHVAVARWDGTTLGITVDGGAEVTTACGNIASVANYVDFERNYTGAKIFKGRLRSIGALSSKIGDTDSLKLLRWARNRHACGSSVQIHSVDDVVETSGSLVIRGKGFTGADDLRLGVIQVTSYTVVSDTLIIATIPAGVTLGSTYTLSVHAGGNWASLVDAVTFYSPSLRADKQLWLHPGTMVVGGGLVTQWTNAGDVADAGRTLDTSSNAFPTYYASDAAFGDQPTLGANNGADEGRTIRSSGGSFATPIAQPVTAYHVHRRISGVGMHDVYWRLNGGTTSSSLAMLQDAATDLVFENTTGSITVAASNDRTHVSAADYNGASSKAWLDAWGAPSASGTLATDAAASLETGTFTGEEARYAESEILVVSGPDSDAVRRKEVRRLLWKYGLLHSYASKLANVTGLWERDLDSTTRWRGRDNASGRRIDFVAGGGVHTNSDGSANFNGSTDYLDLTGHHWDELLSRTAYFIQIEFLVRTLGTGGEPPYSGDQQLLTDNGGNLYVGVSGSGIRFGHYDDAGFQVTNRLALSTDAKHCVQCWYDGTNLNMELDGVAVTPAAAASLTSAYNLVVPRLGYQLAGGTLYLDGLISRVVTMNAVPSSTIRANLLAAAQADWGF